MADGDKKTFQVYKPETGNHITEELTPKEFLINYHEFQNGITKSVSVNGSTSTKDISRDKINAYIKDMPDDKALELANTLNNGKPKEKENALHGFLSNVMGNKQEAVKEEKQDKSVESPPKHEEKFYSSFLRFLGAKDAEPVPEKVAAPNSDIDHKAIIKKELIGDRSGILSHEVDISTGGTSGVNRTNGQTPVASIEKHIDSMKPEDAEKMANRLQSEKAFERGAAKIEVLSAAHIAHKENEKEGKAVATEGKDAPKNAKGTENHAAPPTKPNVDASKTTYTDTKTNESYQTPEKVVVKLHDATDRISRGLLTKAAGGKIPSELDVKRLSDALAKENNFNKHDIKPDFEIKITGDAKAQLTSMAKQNVQTMEKK